MKPLINELCDKCGESFDPTLGECPACKHEGTFYNLRSKYENQSRVGMKNNIILFLIGFAGFQVIGLIISLLLSLTLLKNNPSGDLTELLTTPESQLKTTGLSYIFTCLFLIVICIKNIGELTKSFKKPLNLLKGLGWGLVMIGASIAISTLTAPYFPESSETNVNQSILIGMIEEFPFISLFIFSIVGPLVEELTYRVGLFSLTSRGGKLFGYIISSLIFGLIHFNFASIGTEEFIVEILSLPNYLVAGIILSYIYDKYGLAASFAAHFFNNFVSTVLIALGK